MVDWEVSTPVFLISYVLSQVAKQTDKLKPKPRLTPTQLEEMETGMTKTKGTTPTLNPADLNGHQDMLTGDELNTAVLRKVLLRRSVVDPDAFIMENRINYRIYYRDVPMPDGTTVMMASVGITTVTPRNPQTPKNPQPQSVEPISSKTDPPQES